MQTVTAAAARAIIISPSRRRRNKRRPSRRAGGWRRGRPPARGEVADQHTVEAGPLVNAWPNAGATCTSPVRSKYGLDIGLHKIIADVEQAAGVFLSHFVSEAIAEI